MTKILKYETNRKGLAYTRVNVKGNVPTITLLFYHLIVGYKLSVRLSNIWRILIKERFSNTSGVVPVAMKMVKWNPIRR